MHVNIEQQLEELGFLVKCFKSDNALSKLYHLTYPRFDIEVTLDYRQDDEDIFHLSDTRRKLLAILANGITLDSNKLYDGQRLQAFINENYPTLTPEDKMDQLLNSINEIASYDGEPIEDLAVDEHYAIKTYFVNLSEWEFYRDTAIKMGYLDFNRAEFKGDKETYNLTVEGLSRLLKRNVQNESNTCFVAMSFDDDMGLIFTESIAPAIRQCGFEPYIVNAINLPSDVTINDAILVGIKKAKFTIADFSSHKAGVYFEAGYALGRGQKVIYTCHTDDIANSHFDTRNYQHIVWSDANDFKLKLVDKIMAYVVD